MPNFTLREWLFIIVIIGLLVSKYFDATMIQRQQAAMQKAIISLRGASEVMQRQNETLEKQNNLIRQLRQNNARLSPDV